MRYIWATTDPESRTAVHIQKHNALGEPLWSAFCGIDRNFDRTVNAPWALGRTVCVDCEKAVLAGAEKVGA